MKNCSIEKIKFAMNITNIYVYTNCSATASLTLTKL